MLTVAIPALNEAATIADVVAFAALHHAVDRVLVIDDGSLDDTVRLAREAGAEVLTSSMLGKGPSMHDALRACHTEFILYLDGDLRNLAPDLIDRMLHPLNWGADFVKARFARSAGRVTELTAKPLLRTFFPELANFSQPLGGIIAARRELLERMHFEDDFGVDIGLLIDAYFMGARVVEVDIGAIEHDSKPLANLGRMAVQVSRAILRRAELVGRLQPAQLLQAMEAERQLGSELDALSGAIQAGDKLAFFDMDGTLLNGRFIMALSARLGLDTQLAGLLDRLDIDQVSRSNEIAMLLRGVPQRIFEDVARQIPLQAGAVETVLAIRRAGYRVGIVSDSYFVAAEIVRKRVFADFAVAHIMLFEHGIASGTLRMNQLYQHPSGCNIHSYCKRNLLDHLRDLTGTPFTHTLAVGDGENDICLLQTVDHGWTFHPRSNTVADAAPELPTLQTLPELLENKP